MDAETGYVIAENNADMQLPPASLVKMMTTYIVSNEIAEGRVKKDEMVLISDNAWEKGGAKTDGSTMFLSPRTRVPVMDLMRGVIIQSGNDASIALAEHISGDEDAFTDSMNQQAALLGMTGTEYYNATGLPFEGMVSTARDLSILAEPLFRSIPSTIKSTRKNISSTTILTSPTETACCGATAVSMVSRPVTLKRRVTAWWPRPNAGICA